MPADFDLIITADYPSCTVELRLLDAHGVQLAYRFVFAESRGSRPLAARLERQALQRLLTQDVYPQRRVEAYFLTHGVTRQRLRAQIEENGGYHIVHWSGHGHLNPTFKGMWRSSTYFVRLGVTHTTSGQYPGHHRSSEDDPAAHRLGEPPSCPYPTALS